ncbi:MAG: biotin--[acetyl-CoA-carboxylase] ligase [Bacteroidales bacterium]|jgi:BirA family biotin operon repressor/biotin-[acetyl-CoA-carboxylase] ligase
METTLPNLILFEQVASTNQMAAEWLAEDQTAHGDFFLAEYQTAGRGYGQNSWFSSPSLNLLGTLLVSYKDFPAREQFLVTCVVSVVIADFIEEQTREKAFVKWPNDIYVNDKKICGLLIENQMMGNELRLSLIGIGLNVNEPVFPHYLPQAISMTQLDGKHRNIKAIATQIGSNILHSLSSYDRACSFREKYTERLYRLGISSLYRVDAKTASGVIRGVDEFGRLLLHYDGKDLVLGFKEVEYVF